MGKKTISNTFSVNTVQDGQSAPYYFQEWFAWSNDATTASVTTEPTIGGSWATSIPAQGSYTYLWRKSIRMVYNATNNDYDAESAQYFRMSGTNGTSIKTKGSVIAVISRRDTFPTTGVEDGDIVIKDSDRTPYRASVRGMIVQWDAMSNADDGDSYTVIKTCYYSPNAELNPPDVKGHLFSYSEEASKWLDLGKFQGENGETWYTHVAWATNVDTSTTPITVTDFVTTKSPNDTKHIWMGVLVDQNSGQDSSNATLYTWSNTKGDGAAVATCSPDKISIQCNADGSVVSTNGYSVSFGLKVGSIDISQYITDVTRGSLPTGVSISPTPVAYAKTIVVSDTATATGMASGITFTVTGTYEGKTYSSTVNVALIGVKQGSVGERGKVGRFFYYGGTFDTNNNTPFPINDAQAPYFDYIKDGQKRYSVYNPANNPAGGSLKMSQMTPLSQGLPDLNTTGTSWKEMIDDFKYIITEALFANFAKLGSFIISGDWMLTHYGVIYDTSGTAHTIDNNNTYTNGGVTYSPNNAYLLFDANYPNSSKSSALNFCPSYCVDGLTGETYQQNAHIKGEIIATSGSFTGSIVATSGSLANMSISGALNVDTNGSIVVGSSGYGKVRIQSNKRGDGCIDFFDSSNNSKMWLQIDEYDSPLIVAAESDNEYMNLTASNLRFFDGNTNNHTGSITEVGANGVDVSYYTDLRLNSYKSLVLGFDYDKNIIIKATDDDGNSIWPEYSYQISPDNMTKGLVHVMSLGSLKAILNGTAYNDRLNKLSVLLIRNNV